jgi:hypothetical protein
MPIVTRWKRINNYIDRREGGEDLSSLHVDPDLGGLSCRVYGSDDPDDPGTEVYGAWRLTDGGSLVLTVLTLEGLRGEDVPDGPDVEDRFGEAALRLVGRGG